MKSYVTERIGPKQTGVRTPSVVPRLGGSRLGFKTWRFKTWRLHSRSAGRLAPIVAPHSEERSMDLICRLIERFQFDPHHAAVVHAPRQAHQRAIDWLLAPVGNKSAAERCVERNL